MARPLSIGARWTLRYSAAILVTTSILGAYLYPRVERALYQDARLLLELQVNEIRDVLERHPQDPGFVRDYIASHLEAADPDLQLGIRLFDPEGRLLVDLGTTRGLPPPPRLDVGRDRMDKVELGSRHTHLVLAGRAEHGLVQASIDSNRFAGRIEHIRDVFLMAIPIVLVLTAGLGWWLARGSLRPIADMTAAARRISAARLEERIPVGGSGDELDRLAETLNGMISRIQEGMGEMEAFAGDVAHQLRTPLNALRNQLEVTLEKERPPQEYRRVLLDVHDEVMEFAETVNAMLRLARSLAGLEQQRRSALALGPLLQTVVDFFEPAAEEKGVKLGRSVRDEVGVSGDAAWLHQLFANLLDNAIRFTPSGGAVEVELRREGAHATVHVRDTGVGVGDEERERLFERFQSGSRSRGSGLGLAIAAHIARAHGGWIEVESAPGYGSTFTVRLPLRVESARA